MEIFQSHFPRLLAVVEESLGVELKKRSGELARGQREVLEDCVIRFGATLKAVFAFGLEEALEKETAWLVSVLESRGLGRKWAERILENWTIAVHGVIKPPEANELARLLVTAEAGLARSAGHFFAGAEVPSPDVAAYTQLAVRGRRREAADLALSHVQAGLSPEKVVEKLLLPALRRIGYLWQTNELSAASEHLATEITRYVSFRIFDGVPRKMSHSLTAVLGCVPGDEHDIPIDLMACLLEKEGWTVSSIGRSAPHQDILDLILGVRPDVVFLAASLLSHLPAARALILDIRAKAPGPRLLLGGAAFAAARRMFEPLVDGIASGIEEGGRLASEVVKKHA